MKLNSEMIFAVKKAPYTIAENSEIVIVNYIFYINKLYKRIFV